MVLLFLILIWILISLFLILEPQALVGQAASGAIARYGLLGVDPGDRLLQNLPALAWVPAFLAFLFFALF